MEDRNQFTIADLKKAINYLENNLKAPYAYISFDEFGRLKFNASDVDNNLVTILLYSIYKGDAAAKFPSVTKTETL